MMKTVGLILSVEAQLVAVVMKETVVKMAVDDHYMRRKRARLSTKLGQKKGCRTHFQRSCTSTSMNMKTVQEARRSSDK